MRSGFELRTFSVRGFRDSEQNLSRPKSNATFQVIRWTLFKQRRARKVCSDHVRIVVKIRRFRNRREKHSHVSRAVRHGVLRPFKFANAGRRR